MLRNVWSRKFVGHNFCQDFEERGIVGISSAKAISTLSGFAILVVIGGIAGSAAAWAGWAAATGSMDLLGFLVGFLVFVWTPSHFWCLAMKIKDEYAQAEVPMLPVVIGMQKTSKFILGNTLILIPYSLILVLIPDGLGIVYAIIASVSGGLMLVYHYKLTKTPTSEFAWKAYKVTAPYLTIIFVAVALDAAFHFPLI